MTSLTDVVMRGFNTASEANTLAEKENKPVLSDRTVASLIAWEVEHELKERIATLVWNQLFPPEDILA